MDLIDYLAARGGVMRTRDLRDAGFSTHRIERSIASTATYRPRRGWLALSGADPDLRGAAACGVVLTCVTQAKRLGLWTYRGDDPHRHHLAASAHSGAVTVSQSLVHWSKPLIAPSPGTLVDPIENVLAIIAECQPHERALAVWDSAFQLQW